MLFTAILPRMLMFLGSLGGPEVILILVVVLLLFGAKKIPDLARGLGKGIREFKDASQEIKREIDSEASSIEKSLKDQD
ncbi:MAG: twin-arginine translocase TatA/TatE family subunit [Bacteroidia bacterium]|nr:twin-arginine translocase TatA/TatE family subunit [Bacteroidia bacterium]